MKANDSASSGSSSRVPSSREGDPVHGPFAATWFDEVEQRYRVRLTAEGREKVAEYLARYPRPLRLLISTWPSAYRAARAARLSDEEIDSLCQEGVARAFTRYDPSRKAPIGAVVAWGVRGAVSEAIRKPRSMVVVMSSREIERLMVVRRWKREQIAARSDLNLVEQVRRHFVACNLTRKERRVLALRFGLGDHLPATCSVAGVAMGLSGEYVRQIQEQALRKIRRVLHLEIDWVGVRERILAFLSSSCECVRGTSQVRAARAVGCASKAVIATRMGLPVWQVRAMLARLQREGVVIQEREPLSQGRWRVLYRLSS